MKTWRITMWVDGWDGELYRDIEAKTEEDAENQAHELLSWSHGDVIEVEEV